MQDLRKSLFNEGLSRKDVSGLDARINDACYTDAKNRGKLVGRRPFVIAGATGAVIVGSYLVGHALNLDRPPIADFEYVIVPSETKAGFGYKPNYINPTSEDIIRFFNESTNFANPLSCSLYIDDQLVTTAIGTFAEKEKSEIYSTKLKADSIGTKHKVRLEVKESERLVTLLNKSYDPDAVLPTFLQDLFGVSGSLSYNWSVDSLRSSDKDYSIGLPAGDHAVRLTVSDGRKEDYREKHVVIPESLPISLEKTVEIDPSELYPEKELRVPIKGINMSIGCSYGSYTPEFPPITDDEIVESLNVIRKGLRCNAVRLFGNFNERMITAVRVAKDFSFETVMVSPRYINASIDETIGLITPLAEELETLRDDSIILNIANELTLDAFGLFPGATYNDRAAWTSSNYSEATSKKYQDKLNESLESILEPVRSRFNGKLTCTTGGWEKVMWNRLGFDVVSVNDYYSSFWDTMDGYIRRINAYSQFGKPVHLTEFGYFTFEDCLKYGGGGWAYLNNPNVPFYHGNKPVIYSQEAQAKAIAIVIELLKQTKLSGIYLYAFFEKKTKDIESAGVIRFKDELLERKKSFYMYKSYE